MKQPLLVLKSLDALVAAIRTTGDLVAPGRNGEGNIACRRVASASEMVLSETNTRLSAKGVFFPQRELLMSFRDGALCGAAAITERSLVLFGVRPCDARALAMLDKVFAGTAAGPGNTIHEDPYYLRRRRGSLVISLACENPCGSCFCTSVGGSPFGTAGADILASRAGDADLLFEGITDAGRDFLSRHAALLSRATEGMESARERKAELAEAAMKKLDFAGVKERAESAFASPVWEQITRTCLGCGACTYLCPTCHCFDITDETRGADGVRLRSWDACQYSLFTAHASGHNPRPHKTARMRQRIMHKYCYAVETAGEVFCTGCGRCVRHCPVNLDIREMLAAVKERP